MKRLAPYLAGALLLLVAPALRAAERCHLDHSTDAPEVVIAAPGQAPLPIVIPAQPSALIRTVADDLARCLGTITGTAPPITPGGKLDTGIVIGAATDWPELSDQARLPLTCPQDRAHYVLRSEPGRILCVGAADIGTSHAVYDLLDRLGCRWLAPFPEWEVLPSSPRLAIRVDVEERPDYAMFILQAADAWGRGDWNRRNRNHPDPFIWNAHHLGNIVVALRPTLEKHPEYYSLAPKQGPGHERDPSWWLCLSNPGARQMVADYVLDWFRQHPDRDSISLEPADGDGWCRCADCAKRSHADWLITLANEVAAKLRPEFPHKYIGILSYNQHSAPPTIRADRQVYVLPATAFNHSNLTLEERLDAWQRMTDNPHIGIYDYWNLPIWHLGQPGAKGGQLGYIRRQLPAWYARGVNVLQTESIDGWAQNGLAYHVANNLAWNVDADVDAIVVDYLRAAYGRAAPAMADFHRLLNQTHPIRMSRDFRGRLYRALDRARPLESSPVVQTRLDELTLYVAYLDSYYAWRAGSLPLDDLMSFLWRADSTTQLFDKSRWLWKYLPVYWHLTPPADLTTWQPQGTFTHDEILAMTRAGIAANPTIDFPDTHFSTDLVPAGIETREPMRCGHTNATRFLTWRTSADQPWPFLHTGACTWALHDASGKTLQQGRIEASDTPVALPLSAQPPGLYSLTVDLKAKLSWPAGSPVVMDAATWTGVASNRWHFFYVPPGAKYVILYCSDVRQELRDGDGHLVYDGSAAPRTADYLDVAVPPGQDGRPWRLRGITPARVELINVPPYLALSPDELLVPRECRP